MTTLLEQLEAMTTVVGDTGDIFAIGRLRPRDATTNPSLITSAAQMPEYRDLVDENLDWARKKVGPRADVGDVVGQAIDRLAVAFGLRILEIVPGRLSTEVDARLSYDTGATVAKARKLIAQYEDHDGGGRIAFEEMVLGLGAAFCLDTGRAARDVDHSAGKAAKR